VKARLKCMVDIYDEKVVVRGVIAFFGVYNMALRV
jgi:hypothetical protein